MASGAAHQVARWLDEGVAPSGECGRAHGKGGVHGFDLTFCAPKSVSLARVFGGDVGDKAVTAAHQTAIAEALEYLAAHAGYTRVHNRVTEQKDLVRLPGLSIVPEQIFGNAAHFGADWIVFPNATYGDWSTAPLTAWDAPLKTQ